MPYNVAAQNVVATALAGAITHVGLLIESALAELSGGSPVYARRPVTMGAASGGVIASSADITPFNVPAATIVALGYYSALTAGVFYGYTPLGGFEVEAGEVASATDTITDYAHGLTNGLRVFVNPVHTNSMPTGLAAGTLYYVVNAATDTFQVATSFGGSPVNVTANGKLFYQRCAPQTPPSQSTLPFNAGNITHDVRLLA